jgi:hypothetical protein
MHEYTTMRSSNDVYRLKVLYNTVSTVIEHSSSITKLCSLLLDMTATAYLRSRLRAHKYAHVLASVRSIEHLLLPTTNHTFQVAVTYQRCVIKGVHPRALLSINGQINGIEVGNVKYLRFVLQPCTHTFYVHTYTRR